MEEFGNRLKRGGVGLFYFAGHGVQIGGGNYLLPIGVKVRKESDVKYQAIDANRILDEMANANNGLNIVILDACRDNPYGRNFRNASRGLAIISTAPEGTFISYATAPGQLALDGSGRNSPYTEALMKNMTIPGLPIEQVFKNVRVQLTPYKQTPWEMSSLKGDFYFKPSPVKSEGLIQRQEALQAEQKKQEAERVRLAEGKKQLAMLTPDSPSKFSVNYNNSQQMNPSKAKDAIDLSIKAIDDIKLSLSLIIPNSTIESMIVKEEDIEITFSAIGSNNAANDQFRHAKIRYIDIKPKIWNMGKNYAVSLPLSSSNMYDKDGMFLFWKSIEHANQFVNAHFSPKEQNYEQINYARMENKLPGICNFQTVILVSQSLQGCLVVGGGDNCAIQILLYFT